jgi:SAM-dependent methyltransferase
MEGLRQNSHGQQKEPIMERLLSYHRFYKVLKYIKPNSSVLDIGCGFNAQLLKKIEHTILHGIGIDLEVNQNLSSPKIKLVSYYLNGELPFSDEEFDIVISLANIEHLNNPYETIREIYRVLMPNGLLLLTTPTTYAKPVLETLCLFNLLSKQEIMDHKNYFNKHILTNYSRQSGFSTVNHSYFQLGMNNFLCAQKTM